MKRRDFLKCSAAAISSAAIYTWRIEPHWVEYVYRKLPVQGLPSALHGKFLVHVSDLHVGKKVNDDFLIDTFHNISSLSPDIVVMTGDFISYHPAFSPQADTVYRHFPRGALATIGILGNHDYGRNWSERFVADEIVSIVTSCGIEILRNEIIDICNLQIAGLDDYWAPNYQPGLCINRIKRDRAALVLSHNPDSVDDPAFEHYAGWILSGHTHGGQCKPPFLPPPILPVKNRRYTSGEVEVEHEKRIYINRGLGHLLKVRFNVRPEVTVFELVESN